MSVAKNKIFFKMDQSRPLFIYFRPSLITISIIQFEKSAWDLNLWLQDGRRRQYHRAMAAAPPPKKKIILAMYLFQISLIRQRCIFRVIVVDLRLVQTSPRLAATVTVG